MYRKNKKQFFLHSLIKDLLANRNQAHERVLFVIIESRELVNFSTFQLELENKK